MKNIGLKLLSASIALMLYLFVHAQTNASVLALVVPVEISNIPKDKMVLLPSVRQAQVTFKGPSFMVREVAISSPSFHISMPEEFGDRYEIQLNPEDLPLPPSVEVLSIEPSRIDLIFDTVVEDNIQVEVPRIGRLGDSVRLVSMEVEPKEVRVRGPKTEVNNISSVQSSPIDMRSISASTSFTLPLKSPGQYSKILTDSVKVDVQLATVSVERTFLKVPVEVRVVNGYNYEVKPAVVDVEITGPKKLVNKLTQADIVPFVRVDGQSLAANELDIQLALPESVSIVALSPPRVKMLLKDSGARAN